MGALRHRIMEYIRKAQESGILPERVILSKETFKKLLEDEMIRKQMERGNHPATAITNALGLPFEIGEKDEVVGKGFVPERCPHCSRAIFNPRVRLNDIVRIVRYLERFGKQQMICTCGKIFVLDVEEKRLEIDMRGVSTLTKCPQCGGPIKFLTSTEAFCLRCGWDNLKPLDAKKLKEKRFI